MGRVGGGGSDLGILFRVLVVMEFRMVGGLWSLIETCRMVMLRVRVAILTVELITDTILNVKVISKKKSGINQN